MSGLGHEKSWTSVNISSKGHCSLWIASWEKSSSSMAMCRQCAPYGMLLVSDVFRPVSFVGIVFLQWIKKETRWKKGINVSGIKVLICLQYLLDWIRDTYLPVCYLFVMCSDLSLLQVYFLCTDLKRDTAE